MRYLFKIVMMTLLVISSHGAWALEDNLSTSKALVQEANKLLKIRELDHALESVNKAIEISPNFSEAHFTRAHVFAAIAMDESLFFMPATIKKAFRSLEIAVELEPNNIMYRKDLMNFHLKAPGIFGGDNGEAIKQANSIAKINLEEGMAALLEIYIKTDDRNNFDSTYAEAINTFPDTPEFIILKAIWEQRHKQYNKADELLNSVLSIYNNDKPSTAKPSSSYRKALFYLGKNSLLAKDELELGVSSLQSALETPEESSPISNSHIYLNLGDIYLLLGNQTEAQHSFQQVLHHSNNPSLVKKAKSKLEELE